jgi:uncharacterized lipoprotein YmbA
VTARMSRSARHILCIVALCGLAACSTTPPSRFYTLSSLPPAATRAGGEAATRTLLIGTVEMPQTLDRPQFVRRSGSNKVDVAELDRWSEPLDGMVRRALADDLTTRLNGFRVLTTSLPSVPIDETLMLEIDRFDADMAGAVILNAQWFVLSERVTTPLLSRRSTIEEHAAASDTESIVVAMSRALATLAGEMASALASLPPKAAR